MKPLISIIMGSTSDYPVMEKAAKFLDEMDIPFEVNALSAHRTPEAVESFAKNAKANNIKVKFVRQKLLKKNKYFGEYALLREITRNFVACKQN